MKYLGWAGLLLLAGCTANLVKPAEYSGFLANYERLNASIAADGEEVLRWINPKLEKGQYAKAKFKEVEFYPKLKASGQVAASALANLKSHINLQIIKVAQQQSFWGKEAGQGVVEVSMVITGVKVSNESLSLLDVIPIKLVIAGAGAAIGFRDKDVDIYVEVSGVDSVSREPLFSLVRKIRGEQLLSKWDQMEIADVQVAVDQFIVTGIGAMVKFFRH